MIRTAEQSAAEVVEQLDRANVLSPGPATIALMQSPKWHFRENRVFLSFLKADVRIPKREATMIEVLLRRLLLLLCY